MTLYWPGDIALSQKFEYNFNYIPEDLPTHWFGVWIYSLVKDLKAASVKSLIGGKQNKENNTKFLLVHF